MKTFDSILLRQWLNKGQNIKKKEKKISEINPFNLRNLIQRKKQIKKKKQEEEDNLYNQF